MRRPKMTREQRQYARERAALLTLRRAAVRYSIISEQKNTPQTKDLHLCALADLEAACDRYTEVLGLRDRRKLIGKDAAKSLLRSVP